MVFQNPNPKTLGGKETLTFTYDALSRLNNAQTAGVLGSLTPTGSLNI